MNIHIKPNHPLHNQSPFYADEVQVVGHPLSGGVLLRCLEYSSGTRRDFPVEEIENIMDGQTEDNLRASHE